MAWAIGYFPIVPLGKYLAPQGETLLQQTKGLYHCPLIRPLRGHLPPEGEGLKRAGGEIPLIQRTQSETCPLIRPSVSTGAPSPRGEGFREMTAKSPHLTSINNFGKED